MSSEKKIITLKSSDNETFEVDEAVALESQTIKHMVEDGCADDAIPLPNVTGAILAKVIEYCRKHVEEGDSPLKAFDSKFVKVDVNVLFDLILAANYLNIKGLLDLTCQTVADMIKGSTPEEIRKTFSIDPEEEEVRRENQWAFLEKVRIEDNQWALEEKVRRENQWAFEDEVRIEEDQWALEEEARIEVDRWAFANEIRIEENRWERRTGEVVWRENRWKKYVWRENRWKKYVRVLFGYFK